MTKSRLQRVLMTADTVGGVWTYALELAESLGAHGVQVVLAALGGRPSPGQRDEAARIPNLELRTGDFKLEWMNDPWDDVEASGRWLLELEERYAPDAVHLNTLGHGALAWRTPVLLTVHSCVASWWAGVKREPLPAVWERYRFEVKLALEAVDLLAAPSAAMADAVSEHYGPGLPPCQVVPNGRNPARFRPLQKGPFVFTAGRLWDEAKNVETVARIAPRLRWPVYVAGESRHPNGTEAWFDDCRMLGRLDSDRLAAWYARAAIYALPARYEPFGLTALEAALSGCVLVLGDIPSLREVWEDAAVFVPPDDERALESALGDLIASPTYRAEMSARALDRARLYTPGRMARSYMDLYRAVRSGSLACAS